MNIQNEYEHIPQYFDHSLNLLLQTEHIQNDSKPINSIDFQNFQYFQLRYAWEYHMQLQNTQDIKDKFEFFYIGFRDFFGNLDFFTVLIYECGPKIQDYVYQEEEVEEIVKENIGGMIGKGGKPSYF